MGAMGVEGDGGKGCRGGWGIAVCRRMWKRMGAKGVEEN